MRLTTSHKMAIVRRVMDDVPFIDYPQQAEEIINRDMLQVAPPKLRPILQDKELRNYVLNGNSSYHPGVYSAGGRHRSVTIFPGYKPSIEALEELQPIIAIAKTQYEFFQAMKTKVEGAIKACTTTGAVLKYLPEFEKYLPIEEKKVTTLPAIANLAADLTKMGWPK